MKTLKFQKKILSWYKIHKRNLPWRKTCDPYAILVSEIMLQQTQVERVIPFFKRWMESFPTVQLLAKAELKIVLSLWSGLGYNNRGLRLQKTAVQIVETYNGIIPDDEIKLMTLPGIGPYTARAILAFAFNKSVPVIDTNIRRIYIHELHLSEKSTNRELEKIALETIPKNKSRIWHNALMDYGALHLTAKKTGISPLTKQSRFMGSDRQVRGYIIKILLAQSQVSFLEIKKLFPDKNVTNILKQLIDEGLVIIKNNTISFP